MYVCFLYVRAEWIAKNGRKRRRRRTVGVKNSRGLWIGILERGGRGGGTSVGISKKETRTPVAWAKACHSSLAEGVRETEG